MKLNWESLAQEGSGNFRTCRAKVPGGWLVAISGNYGGGLTFYPDPRHEWDGQSLP